MLNFLQKIEDTRVETDTSPAFSEPFREMTYETGNFGYDVGFGLPTTYAMGLKKPRDIVFMQVASQYPNGVAEFVTVDNGTTLTVYGNFRSPWAKHAIAKELGSFEVQSFVYPKTHGTNDIEQLIAQLSCDSAKEADPLNGYEKYAVENWDGYEALPITSGTLHAARSIFRSLPKAAGEPVCSPGADGSIVFEWLKDEGPLRKLFVDIGPERTWKAYWRLAGGRTGTIPREPITMNTIPELQKLFETLFRG